MHFCKLKKKRLKTDFLFTPTPSQMGMATPVLFPTGAKRNPLYFEMDRVSRVKAQR